MVGLSLSIAALLMAPTPKAQSFVGVYEAQRFANGVKLDNARLPVGQVTWLELHAEGHWELRTLQSGFDGSWKLAKGRLVLTATSGPAGKLSKPDVWVLVPKPDRSRLVPVSPKMLIGQIEFHYDPGFRARLKSRAR